jgi:hypothetical protein
MVIAIYFILLLVCSFTLCIFGFFVGRCARKLPIIDNNLPWTLHRGQIPAEGCETKENPTTELPRWPWDSLHGMTSRPARHDEMQRQAGLPRRNASAEVRQLAANIEPPDARPSITVMRAQIS